MQKLFISNLSLLGRKDLVLGLLTGRWPTFEDLWRRSEQVGSDGMQLTMLRGWNPTEVANQIWWHVAGGEEAVCAVEGPWHSTDAEPGFIGERLFGKSSYKDTNTLLSLLERSEIKPIVVDMELYPDTCIEIVDLPGRAEAVGFILASDEQRGLVYDTWHVREVLHGNYRRYWTGSLLENFFREPVLSMEYSKDFESRRITNEELTSQWERLRHRVKMAQIQTRSWAECARFLSGEPTMLGHQVLILRRHFLVHQKPSFPVVIECPPYWGLDVQKKILEKVRELLE